MKLDEAIERLSSQTNRALRGHRLKDAESCQLGIEAIKFRQRWEDQEGEPDFPLLPGETQE